MARTKWEYIQEKLRQDRTTKEYYWGEISVITRFFGNATEALDYLGIDGWELVAFNNYGYVFKRELIN